MARRLRIKMTNKLYAIVNDSDVYILNKVREIYTSWGYTPEQMLTYTTWQDGLASQTSLFMTHFVKLDLTRDQDRTNFKDLLKKKKKLPDNWFGNGVIVVCHKAPGKWLKDLIEEYDGTYDGEISIDEILETINLSKENKEFVKYYVGDSAEDLIIIKNTLSGVADTDKLTIDELYSYLPNKMGAVPPWQLINAVMSGNMPLLEQEFQRVITNTHPLVIMKLLKNKFQDFVTYRALTVSKMSEKEICELLGYNSPYRLIDFKRSKCKHEKEIMFMLYKYEFKFKEGNAFLPSSNDLLHSLLIKITLMSK